MKKMDTQFLTSKKTMINVIKEPSKAHKNTLKEEILQEITKKFMGKILDIVKQSVQDAIKKFQNTKNKEHEKQRNK
jgi:hypothetical protein